MSDQTIDVGAIRPLTAAWLPEEPVSEARVTPPGLRWATFGSPTDVPAPPVGVVSVTAGQLVADRHETWSSRVSDLARERGWLSRHRHRDLWLVVQCLAVLASGLVTLELLDAYGLASWVALCGVLCVAVGTRAQLGTPMRVQVRPVLRALPLAFAATALLSPLGLASRADLTAAAWVVLVAGIVMTTLVIARRVARRPARVVVVGDRAAISRAAMRWSDGSVHVIGGVLAEPQNSHLQAIVGVPTIAGIEDVPDWARGRGADLVVVVPGPGLSGAETRQLAWSLERSGIRIAVADVVSEVAPHRIRAGRLGRSTVVELAPTRRHLLARAAKSLVDRVVGSLLLFCAAPFLAVMAVLIRLDSPGTALFRQVRIGQGGKPFTMYKLRTMRVDAERLLVDLRSQNEGNDVLFKMHDDPRVTRVGRFLRRTSMDELPQLINVVKGQMSLVGPRPALPCEVEGYDEVECRRLALKPGMTGLWQVSGRSNLDWDTSIALDLDYVDNWRISDDFLIGLRTVGAVAGARGAY